MQLLSLVVLLVIFGCRARPPRGAGPGDSSPGSGCSNSLAVMLRQENVLFGFAAVALFTVGRRWRRAMRDALVYAVAGGPRTVDRGLLIGLGLAPLGSPTVAGAVQWYLWISGCTGAPTQDFQGFEHATRLDGAAGGEGPDDRVHRTGTEPVVDSMRDRALLGRPYVLGLIALTVAAYARDGGLLLALQLPAAAPPRRDPAPRPRSRARSGSWPTSSSSTRGSGRP